MPLLILATSCMSIIVLNSVAAVSDIQSNYNYNTKETWMSGQRNILREHHE